MTETEASDCTAPKPRLVILGLRLTNFKSYGGVVDVGPFHNNFSAIVGPNGSGKSNVIDAMLFVFGKRAKQMRLSKISELIHNSKTGGKVGSASVTVSMREIVDSEPAARVVEGSDLQITRTVFQNSTSKYFVNGNVSTFSDVQKLLGTKGIDLDNNRFLILQGEVEQISLMKPKAPNPHEDGLLEYLEDIIGSNRFVERIEQTATEVDEAGEERALQLTRVRAVERERDSLEGAKAEAEEFLEKQAELARNQLAIYRHRAGLVERQRSNVAEKISELEDAIREQGARRIQLEAELHEDQKKLAPAKEEHEHAGRRLIELRAEFAGIERQDIELREAMKHLKGKTKKATAAVAREEHKATEQRALIKQYNEDHSHLRDVEAAAREAQSEARTALDRELERVKQCTGHLRAQIENKQRELLPHAAARDERVRELKGAEQKRQMAEEKLQAPKIRMEKVQEQLEGARDSLAKLTDEHQADLMRDLECSRARRDTLQRTADQRRAELQSANGEVNRLRRHLEETKQALSSGVQASRADAAIGAAIRDGTLEGVVGKLCELATADPHYDFAIGAAAGGALNNIVVDTPENAQACVEFLRRNNLGRATFIILSKLEYLRSDMERPCRPQQRRLFDLLSVPDPRNRTAFYYAVRDTLVAEDLESATRLAFQPTRRNRVVTPAGQLIDSSGSMTGGGGRPPRARLGSKSTSSASKQDLARAEELLREQRDRAQVLEQEFAQSEKELDDLTRSISAAETELRKLDLESTALRETVRGLENQLPTLRRECEQAAQGGDQSGLEQLVHEEDARRWAVEDANVPCRTLEQQIATLEEEIFSAGGSSLQRAKQALEDADKRADKAVSCVQSASLMKESSAASLSKAEHAREALTAELDQLKKQFAAKQEQLEGIDADAMRLAEAISAEEAALAEKEDELRTLRQRNEQFVRAAAEARSMELDGKHKRDDLGKTLQELGSKGEYWRAAIASTREELLRLAHERSGKDTGADENAMDCDSDGGEESELEHEGADSGAQMSEEECSKLEALVSQQKKELAAVSPDVSAIAEYNKREAEYTKHVATLDEITAKRDEARRSHEELKRNRHEVFMAGFKTIATRLKEMYQMITLGGDAELELVDSLDPFSEGIVFSVRPPKKSWKNIANLSGGEKTLSSLSLVFALHHFKPTPLYFMDEIDAALDFRNVSIVANYVKERTKDAQFIIISLRNNMFELADRLVGIYKTEDSTKSVTIDPHKFVVPSPSEQAAF